MSRNLILGSSHALKFARAVGHFEATLEEVTNDLLQLESGSGNENWLLFATNRPSFVAPTQGPDGRVSATFGPLIDKIRTFNQAEATVVLAVGGNEHNIRFLTAGPRPFDFHHPSSPAIDPRRQIIPASEMDAIVRALLQRTLAVTRLIAAELPAARRYVLAPPPPIPSEEQIRTNPAIFDFAKFGVEDATVRLKIYNLYVGIVRAFCDEAGLAFIPPVAANRDQAGFLQEAYWEGATHANEDYYRPIVSELGL